MKIHRFYCNFEITGEKIIIRDKEQVKQIKNVLRLGINDKLAIFSEGSPDYLCAIVAYDNQGCHLILEEEGPAMAKNWHPPMSLYCSVLKKENFELVVQKACELGVSEIVPIICERTVKTGLNMDRLGKIAIEAIEQSGQNHIPTILEPKPFADALIRSQGKGLNILLNMAPEKIKDLSLDANHISIFVGPEGGWIENEISQMGEKGFVTASLCPSTLRAETAAIGGLAAVVSRF